MKKIVVVMVTVLMILAMAPLPALAADGTISASSTHDLSEYGNDSTITINPGLTVTLTNTGDVTYTNLKIVCGTGVKLTLSGVKIDNSATSGACALKFSGSGNILDFLGNTNLKSGSGAPGISVESGVSLVIDGMDDTVTLDIVGGSNAAGIGGSQASPSAGSITISGGDVETNGGTNAAGIGGGDGGSGGSITISGDIVTARGGDNAASIGGGNGAGGGTINISGGYVTAEGGDSAAGIGTGYNVETNTTLINISGGNITAGCEGGDGAGIGGGEYSPGGTINISGSANIFSSGGTEAAGIGGGYYGNGGNITITGGDITAIGGGDGGAGIGSGDGGGDASNGVNGGTIVISGGIVEAYGGGPSGSGEYGAGIGGGDYCSGGNITISGNADITAEGGADAAGIGGGYEGDGGVIAIKGSAKVTATGAIYAAGVGSGYNPYNYDADTKITISENADVTAWCSGDYGAGIGGGYSGTGGEIKILGGIVDAQGGKEGAGIGGGPGGGCSVTIEGGTVEATGGSAGAGIGTGEAADTGSITISGGSVTAQGGNSGAGIGGGYYSGGGTITISGGTVGATGGGLGAGIGSGDDADYEGKDGGDITISGGIVTAISGSYSAGIGGSNNTDAGTITIEGGTVTAKGGADSAAIGGGDGGGGGTIDISGGIVYAMKDEFGTNDIGGGTGGDGTISISGTAAVLLGTDTISPDPPATTTHTHYDITTLAATFYGVPLPVWAVPYGAYLNISTLNYDGNGGSGFVAGTIQQAGTQIIVSANSFTNTGYEFECWNTAEDGSGDSYDPGDIFTFPAGDTTLYAQWKIAEGVQTGSIGALLSDGSGNPLEGYTIELHSTVKTGITDANGEVTFDIVPYVDHTLIIKNSSNSTIATFNLNMTKGTTSGFTVDGSNINITFTEDTVAVQISLSYDGEVVSVEDVTIIDNPDTGDSSGWLIWLSAAAFLIAAGAILATKRART